MGISTYLSRLRAAIGSELVLCPGVAAVIRDDRGWVLAHRRRDNGKWSLPGGAIDPGERPADAIIREVFEETGLTVLPVSILAVLGGSDMRFAYPNGDVVEVVVTVFACEVTDGGVGASFTSDETSAVRYVFPGEGVVLFPEYPISVPELLRGSGYFQPPS